jgi:hypothetical protein
MVMAESFCAVSDFWSGRWDGEVVIEVLGKKFKVFEDSVMNPSGKEAGDAEGIDGRLLKWSDGVRGLGNKS